VQER